MRFDGTGTEILSNVLLRAQGKLDHVFFIQIREISPLVPFEDRCVDLQLLSVGQVLLELGIVGKAQG